MTPTSDDLFARARAVSIEAVAGVPLFMQAGYALAEMTLDEARSFRPSGVESVAGVGGRETADAEAGQ